MGLMGLGQLGKEGCESLAWVGCLHKGLADEETTEACLTQFTDGLRIADTAFAHLDSFSWQSFCETEGVLYIGDEGTEVAVVDAA